MKTINLLLLAAVAAFGMTSCNKGTGTTESGLKYQVFTKDANQPKAKVGDWVTMQMVYKTATDSVIFDSRHNGSPVRVPVQNPAFKGGIEEGFTMLAVGDSGIFTVLADSLFAKTFHAQMPPFIKPGSMISFHIAMQKIESKDVVEAEMKKKQEAAMQEAEMRKTAEPTDIENYLKQNNLKVKPLANGLYIIKNQEGSGAKAEKGKKAVCEYTGKFLNGQTFDSSVGKKPFEFTIGASESIPGMEEAVMGMKVGGKLTVIIPSNLAYGPNGASGIIPPYSPLLFDVELVSLK